MKSKWKRSLIEKFLKKLLKHKLKQNPAEIFLERVSSAGLSIKTEANRWLSLLWKVGANFLLSSGRLYQTGILSVCSGGEPGEFLMIALPFTTD